MSWFSSLGAGLVGLLRAVGSRIAAVVSAVRERPRSLASGGFVAVAAVGLLVAVFLSDGFRARAYDLEDAYVWVTDGSEVMRYNRQTEQLDWKGQPDPDGESAEVVQDGTDVFAVSSGTWHRTDVAEGVFEPLGVGSGAEVVVGGGTLAALDGDGAVWVTPADRAEELEIEGPDTGEDAGGDPAGDGAAESGSDESDPADDAAEEAEPAFDAGEGAVVAAGRYGDVAVLTADRDRLVLLSDDADAEPAVTEVAEDVAADDRVEVTLVGRRPVALVGTALILPDGSVQEIDADTARLQLPGDDADEVLVATGSDLLAVPLGGGEPRSLTDDVEFASSAAEAEGEGDAEADSDGEEGGGPDAAATTADPPAGDPQRPVAVGDQRAAVWAGAGARLYWSADGSDGAEDVELAQMRPGFSEDELRFRVNRNYVVLNNVTTGEVYVLIDGELRTSKWQDVQPKEVPDQEAESNDENPISFEPTENRPPVANPDEYGARPGLPTIMYPLDNDEDPDSDVLTIDLDQASVPSGAKVELVQGAQALQVTPSTDEEPFTFRYRAYDGNPDEGKGFSDWARVTVNVFGADVNNPPELKRDDNDNPREPRLDVGAKSSADYQVLQDYVDPEGDPIYLKSAAPENPEKGSVAARANGKLTYTDLAGEPGATYASVVVSDAPMLANVGAESTDGRLDVAVAADDLDPVARNDFVSTLAGTPVVVQPLANDEDPNGDTLSFELKGLENVPENVSVTKNPDDTVTVVAPDAGPVNFGYELTAGGRTATARIRVQVVDDADQAAPSAGLDLVVLPRPTEGRAAERTVDLLANDYSPQGHVLVATGLSGLDESNPDASLITAQLLELRRLRVLSDAPPPTPLQFRYTLSDGESEVDGTVVVVGSDTEQDLPPVTADDVVTVRSGDVVSVPVLANDVDPEGARLHVGPEVSALDDNDGTAWAAGSRVRFAAPTVPRDQTRTIDLQYLAYDGAGPDFSTANGTPGRLRVRVTNPGDGANGDPRPRPVEARVLAGKQVKITVPTSGIDPDGDSVVLVGIGFRNGTPDAPTKGRVVGDPGVDSFVYEAFPDQRGTDVFTYKVVDSSGAAGFGQVRVGIAEGGANQAPVALRDRYQAAPGAPLTVDPLANDIDSDGDPIDVVDDDPFLGYDGPLDPQVRQLANGTSGVRLQVPDQDGQVFSLPYRITDTVGATDDATIELFVSRDAAGRPPVARDDRAEVDDPSLTSVRVPVLDNDSDPDGDVADLELESLDPNATVVAASGDSLAQLEISLTDRPQIVVYRVTDAQGLTGHAVVRVPAAGETVDQPPVWEPAGPCAREVEMPGDRTESGIVFEGAPENGVTIDLAECGFSDPEGNTVRFVLSESLSTGVSGKLTTEIEDGGTTFTLTDRQRGRSPYVDVVTLVVTDAPEGQTGQEILVQIPVGVIAETDAAVNEPPVWRRSTTIEVTQDGEPSLPVDLTRLVEDPEDDELTFKVERTSGGLEVPDDVSGGTLRLVGSEDLALGEGAAWVEVSVTDGPDDHKATQRFPVSGIVSNKPLPTLRPVPTVDATRDEPSPQKVLEGATDPVGGLKVIRAESGANPGDLRWTTDEVIFTPRQVGPATVSFVAEDDLGRQVTGTVTYTVAAAPAPPTTPQVLDFTYDSVTLRWGQAEENGSPIERYDVTASPGDATASCGTDLSCTVDGLRPGTAYTFTVTATNEKGPSEPSPPSAPITPDECPKAPRNVSLSFVAESNPATGGQLVARWAAPENNGTRIEEYEISVDPGGQVVPAGPAATEQVITGLTNGTEHDITIRARNGCEGGWGDEALAGPATPAGRPDPPAGVDATVIDDPVGGRVSLRWTAPTSAGSPSNNGDEVTSYTIREVSGRRAPETIQASQVSLTGAQASYELAVDKREADLRFTVEATNKAGTGTASAPSPAVTAPSEPDPPTISSVTATGQNGQVRVDWSPPTNTGGAATIRQTQYQVGDGAWTPLPSTDVIGGLANGTSYTVRLRVLNERYESDPSTASAAVIPYGPVAPPNVSSFRASATSVGFSWSPPTPATNGRPIKVVRYRINSGGWRDTNEPGSRVEGNGYSQSYTITVQRCDSEGQCAERSAQRSTDPPPAAIEIWWGPTGTSDIGSCDTASDGCRWIHGRVLNFPANRNFTMSCVDSGGAYYSFTVSTNGSGAGAFPYNTCLYGVRNSATWVTGGGARSNSITPP